MTGAVELKGGVVGGGARGNVRRCTRRGVGGGGDLPRGGRGINKLTL